MHGKSPGLCAVIGMSHTDAAPLAAELALSGRILVHGIALDDKSLLQAREVISRHGAEGFAAVEKLSLTPLPYRDNLVNIMVVPDLAEASAAGFSNEEALRAVAPLGKLCIRNAGKWSVTKKDIPAGMDEWTHNVHGPDGNRRSQDKIVSFPVGYRWHGGLPFNIDTRLRHGNRYSATRGMAVSGGRCFTFSDSVIENLKDAYFQGQELDQYVTARDAFNGMFLWRRKIGRIYYGGLWYTNLAPFATANNSIFTVCGKGNLLVLDAATGTEIRTIDTTYTPGELLVDRDTVVTVTWKGGTSFGKSKANRFERRRMHSAVTEGTVEAYNAASGQRLWIHNELVTSIRSADGMLFMLQREGPDLLEESRRCKPKGEKKKQGGSDEEAAAKRPAQAVVAVELKTGKPLWKVLSAKLAGEEHEQEHLRLDAAGLGVVTVVHARDLRTGKVSVLSSTNGELLLQADTHGFPVLADNAVHMGGKQYDPATGKELGRSSYTIGGTVCTPSYTVGSIIVRNRGGGFSVDGKSVSYAGARGSCSLGSVPALGAFYTPQNWCTCCPPQISGFICFGPVRGVPTQETMMKTPATVKGPASGTATGVDNAREAAEWPMLRHGANRSSATPASAPTELHVLWQEAIPSPKFDGPVSLNWREYLNAPLTAPTVAGGVVATAVMDANQVVGLDLNDGRVLWRFTAGARIDSSPTLYRGVCLFGAHDGFVYALDARTGRLRWKLRMAPHDERMMSYGKVESPWPVIGSVLVVDGVAYASAGRTQGSDGGIVVRAFSPFTGEVTWSRPLQSVGSLRNLRRNDLIFKNGNSLQLMVTKLDPETGELKRNPIREVHLYHAALNRLSRGITAAKKNLAEANGKTPAIEKKIKQLEEQLQNLEEPEGEMGPSLGSRGTGSEGYVNWNWPRLGTRKFRQMNYGNVGGTLVSWDARSVCRMVGNRAISTYSMDKIGEAGDKVAHSANWTASLPSTYQVTSLVLCSNAVVTAGGIYDEKEEGKNRGFVCVMSRNTGEKTAEYVFAAPVVYSSIAVLDKRICAALEDSSVCLLGPN